MATFATRLKELRGKSGLSQPQLAQEIGVTKQTISLWERGPRRPDFQTMENLADFFNVKLGYLLGEIDDDSPAVEMDDKSIEEYQRYPSFVLSDSEWEERRYEIAKEIYINKLTDFSRENAELALMAADDFIGVLRKHYQNKD